MAQLLIKVGELDTDVYQQYQSVMAFIVFKNGDEILLQAQTIDNEDYEADLELVEAFCTSWEIKSLEDKISIRFDESVDDLIDNLNVEIEHKEEELQEEQRRDEKNGLYPDKWDDAN